MLMSKVKKSDWFLIPKAFFPRPTGLYISRAQIQCCLDLNNCAAFEKQNN